MRNPFDHSSVLFPHYCIRSVQRRSEWRWKIIICIKETLWRLRITSELEIESPHTEHLWALGMEWEIEMHIMNEMEKGFHLRFIITILVRKQREDGKKQMPYFFSVCIYYSVEKPSIIPIFFSDWEMKIFSSRCCCVLWHHRKHRREFDSIFLQEFQPPSMLDLRSTRYGKFRNFRITKRENSKALWGVGRARSETAVRRKKSLNQFYCLFSFYFTRVDS